MASDLHVIDLLPAYALGCLGEEEAVRVSEHLAHCAACRAELVPYQDTADQLALAAPDAQPPARLKQRLMRRIEPPRAAPVPRPQPGWQQALAGLFRRPSSGWALASLIVIVALGAGNVWLWERASRSGALSAAGSMRVVALAATDAAPGASGKLVISRDGEYGTLVADGLPALDAGHQYQVWLIRAGQPTSGGVFSVGNHGYGVIEILAPEPLGSYPSFSVTVEPSGGSPAPTGAEELAGHL